MALAEQCSPSLIITDLGLPDMDGFAVLAALRDSPRLASVPVCVLTARSDDESRRRAMALGARSYLTKPFTLEQVLAVVG